MASLQWLAQLNAVLSLEMTARQVIGSCEGNEQSLSAGVERCDGRAQNRGERPIGVEFNGSVRGARPGWLRDGYAGSRLVVVGAGIRDHYVRAIVPTPQKHQEKAR